MIDLIGKLDHLKDDPDMLDAFWRFARGDTGAANFEAWLYAGGDVEAALGKDAYLDAISVDYRDAQQIAEFRGQLHERLPGPDACECHTIADFGGHIDYVIHYPELDRIFQRTQVGLPDWLHRLTCRTCAQSWIAAHDNEIYGLVMVRDPTGSAQAVPSWPVQVRLAMETDNPWHPPELRAAIEELAKESPGVSVTELAAYFPTDREVVLQQARDAVARTGVRIDFDGVA